MVPTIADHSATTVGGPRNLRGAAVLAGEDRVRHPRGSGAGAPAAGPHLMRASPCGQQTAKPPRPRKSRNVGSIPGPVRHFCGVIHAGAWRGSCQPSPDRIIASVLLQPAEPRDAGITILFEEHSLCSKRDGLRRLTEFQPLPSPPALPAARHSNLLSSPHLTRKECR